MHITTSGGGETPYAFGLYHNARGQRLSIYFGNGTNAAYTYDPNTFRETQLVIMRSADVMQNLNYWYDPVSNITIHKDGSQRALFFDNSIILPEQHFTYSALYRLIRATGRKKTASATWGATASNIWEFVRLYVHQNISNRMRIQQRRRPDGQSVMPECPRVLLATGRFAR